MALRYPARTVVPALILSLFLGLISCTNPSSGTDNSAPWPVTGPLGPVFLTTGGGEMTVDLEITNTDTGAPVTNPVQFDPDSDPVTFVETLVENNSPVVPVVTIDSNGVMHITDDAGLAGLVKYTVAAGDGEDTTAYAGTGPITLFFSSPP